MPLSHPSRRLPAVAAVRLKPLSTGAVSLFALAALATAAQAQQAATQLPPVPVQPPVQVQAKQPPAVRPKQATPAPQPRIAPKPQAKAAPKQPALPPVAVAAPTGASPQVTGVGSSGLAVPTTTTAVAGDALAQKKLETSDTASLINDVPGAGVHTAGGVSGLPTINGLADDRIRVAVAGMAITSACANHMNSPLSYSDPAIIGSVEVLTGVTPVSKGGDSLAGTILVEPAAPNFAAGDGVRTSGRLSAFYRSNNQGIGGSGTGEVATRNVSLRYDGAWSKADNYRDGHGDEVKSTEYEARNQTLTLSARQGGDLFTLQGGHQKIPLQGYPNQRMDMVDNTAWFVNGRYLGRFGWGLLEARAFYQQTSHEMNFLDDKKYNKLPPYRHMPMLTDGSDAGYALKAEIGLSAIDTVRIGNEFHHQALNDWWTATTAGVSMMGPNTYVTLNDATRNRVGTFVEWERKWAPTLSTLLGVRNDTVWMDTGDVQGYNNVVGGMAGVYALDAAAFNARSHARTDSNFDVTALVRHEPSPSTLVEAGYAMKSRAPNLYERYAWSKVDGPMDNAQMAMNMFGWFGDGNGYTGNLDLRAETAHTASVTFGVHDAVAKDWSFKLTPYYTFVDDYIGVRKIGNAINHPGFVNLQFANHDAELYGVNASGIMPLASTAFGKFALTGSAGYVHGKNADTGVSLYHMMPLHGRLALTHRIGGWSNAVELEAVGGKHNVDTVRNELQTAGYSRINLRSSYEVGNVRFDLGVENLFDTYFEHPLGGHYVEPTMPGHIGGAKPKDNVPGMGRSLNAGVTLKF